MLSVVKMLLKGEVGGRALNSHGNYIVDHGKSWKNHGIVFLNFCGNLVMSFDVRSFVQGPFREPEEVQKQRYKAFQPTLRVATSFTSLEDAREKMKAEEWLTRLNDDM